MTYMDNATVTELRASCQQMECACAVGAELWALHS